MNIHLGRSGKIFLRLWTEGAWFTSVETLFSGTLAVRARFGVGRDEFLKTTGIGDHMKTLSEESVVFYSTVKHVTEGTLCYLLATKSQSNAGSGNLRCHQLSKCMSLGEN